jgi:hypothetical protein
MRVIQIIVSVDDYESHDVYIKVMKKLSRYFRYNDIVCSFRNIHNEPSLLITFELEPRDEINIKNILIN